MILRIPRRSASGREALLSGRCIPFLGQAAERQALQSAKSDQLLLLMQHSTASRALASLSTSRPLPFSTQKVGCTPFRCATSEIAPLMDLWYPVSSKPKRTVQVNRQEHCAHFHFSIKEAWILSKSVQITACSEHNAIAREEIAHQFSNHFLAQPMSKYFIDIRQRLLYTHVSRRDRWLKGGKGSEICKDHKVPDHQSKAWPAKIFGDQRVQKLWTTDHSAS